MVVVRTEVNTGQIFYDKFRGIWVKYGLNSYQMLSIGPHKRQIASSSQLVFYKGLACCYKLLMCFLLKHYVIFCLFQSPMY